MQLLKAAVQPIAIVSSHTPLSTQSERSMSRSRLRLRSVSTPLFYPRRFTFKAHRVSKTVDHKGQSTLLSNR